ncbi:hypothetical protein AAFF_G00224230 [Aldrovandia affinis]|uniref:Uncharacterized protein n=1 Tax=Aldrovandia affinis TaxID=143900 RepID=A0AAD7TAY4_9TELE|nr:hypothetical protein AAFF_G00224230 [Aldrovandia affinis]
MFWSILDPTQHSSRPCSTGEAPGASSSPRELLLYRARSVCRGSRFCSSAAVQAASPSFTRALFTRPHSQRVADPANGRLTLFTSPSGPGRKDRRIAPQKDACGGAASQAPPPPPGVCL